MTRLFATNPPQFSSVSPFSKAVQYVGSAEEFVREQIGYIKNEILPGALTSLSDSITNLGTFQVSIPDDLQFFHPPTSGELNLDMNIDDVDQTSFGQISFYNPVDPPTPDAFPTIDDPNIFPFVPSIEGINVPPPPGQKVFPEPGLPPENPGFSFPDSPDIVLPDEPALLGIRIPDAPDITLPTLDLSDFPVLQEMNIDTMIDWTEPVYSPEIWTDVKSQLQTFFAGGTGIRPDVEEAIVNRGRDREDRIIRQTVQQALEEWANRGYTAPPGMLAKRLENIREEGTLKKIGLQREVVIKAMDVELENLRFAVQQGIVAEDLFIRIHLAAVERLFMVQRLNIEWQIALYNLAVQVYQARMQENVIRAQIYEVQVRAALAEIEVFKALIEAERAKTEVNVAIIQAYKAQIEARTALVDMYVAQVSAVKIQADVYATEVTANKTEVEAFAARVSADKLRFDAYETQIRGESVKADIIEAEARAYQAQMGGIETGVRAQVAQLEGAVSAFQAEVTAYDANLRHWLGLNQNELAQIQANVAGHQADTQRFVAAAGVEVSANELEASVWESTSRIALETYRTEIERMRVIMEKAIQEAGLILEALKSSGELTSTLSAGALAAMHVGATSGGSAAVNASGNEGQAYSLSESYAKNCATSQNTSINVEADTFPGYYCGFDPTDPDPAT
jgi:hypothetical protein